jgi:hypothetical protein
VRTLQWQTSLQEQLYLTFIFCIDVQGRCLVNPPNSEEEDEEVEEEDEEAEEQEKQQISHRFVTREALYPMLRTNLCCMSTWAHA